VSVALDTNVLLYAEGANDSRRQRVAIDAIAAIAVGELCIPAQVLAELGHALRARAGRSAREVLHAVQRWSELARVIPTTTDTVTTAAELAARHQLQMFDAIILVAAREAGCDTLMSEDMQDGFEWSGVRVVDPFGIS